MNLLRIGDWRANVSLGFLAPDFIRLLRGGSESSRKARALIMHDRLITKHPRGTAKDSHSQHFKADDQCLNKSA